MRKILFILIAICIVLSCTACGIQYGDTAKQELFAQSYVKTYYGDATIIKRDTALLKHVTTFVFKDARDSFEYPVIATEVYMSDLGFKSEDNIDDTTVLIESYFLDAYANYLLNNKVDHDAILDVIKKYESVGLNVVIRDMEITSMSSVLELSTETAFIMNELDEDAARDIAMLMKNADNRDFLLQISIPIYSDIESDKLLGYYDFLFDRVVSEDEWVGVDMLHDYLYNTGIATATINRIELEYPASSITSEEGFSWVKKNDNGTYIVFTVGDTSYEFHTSLGVKEFDTDVDDFGIHEGSFLDVLTTDRTGVRPVYIAMYAIMYPEEYQSLAVFCREVN